LVLFSFNAKWAIFLARLWWDPGLTLEGDSGKEVALWVNNPFG
jgi:hypothetical protein